MGKITTELRDLENIKLVDFEKRLTQVSKDTLVMDKKVPVGIWIPIRNAEVRPRG